MSRKVTAVLSSLLLFATVLPTALAGEAYDDWSINCMIRKDKFRYVLPQAMRNNDINMWIVIDKGRGTEPLFPRFLDRHQQRQRPFRFHRPRRPDRKNANGRPRRSGEEVRRLRHHRRAARRPEVLCRGARSGANRCEFHDRPRALSARGSSPEQWALVYGLQQPQGYARRALCVSPGVGRNA